ncbi:MAG: IclR family transcriptional regulator [Phycicoccus sp.]
MIQSIDRALRVLVALQGTRRMSLGEIAARLDLPPSTVHGIVRTLLAHGMVVQERDSGRYRLGPATLRLGNVYLDTLELRSRVATWADDLAERTGLAARTAVLLLTDVVVVHHATRPDGSRQMPEVGIVIPAHASALGKAILAFDAEARAEVLGGATGPRSMTGETITDPTALDAQLDEVRRTGLATEAEEAVLGEYSVAMPVIGAAEEVVGALGLVVPSSDWPAPAAAVDALRATVRSVSRELGAQRWPPPLAPSTHRSGG